MLQRQETTVEERETLRPCPVCGSADGHALGELPVTHHGAFSRPSFALAQCACSLMYLSPLPTNEDLRQLYEENIQFDSPEYDRIAEAMPYMKSCLTRLLSNRRIETQPIRILEVGAGLAWMCRAAHDLRLDAETIAQDVSPECGNRCAWVDRYLVGPLELLDPADIGSFDVISLTHVFEHVPDPVAVLRRLKSLLKTDGVIFLTMPFRPRDWKGDLETWRQYSYNHVPAHLQYFSEASLVEAAQQAGLRLTYWDTSQDGGEALEAHLSNADESAQPVRDQVRAAAPAYRRQFETAQPFKHVVIETFFKPEFAQALLRDFPRFDPERAKNEFGEVGGKAVNERLESISPAYTALSSYLRSEPFLRLMSELTGIPDLQPDPNLFGGGTHENLHGQELDPHIDFNYDPPTKMHRRLNLLVYLNEEWSEDWGGSIELHSNPRRPDENVVKAFLPTFNRALIFETNEYSWHGFPKILLPDDKRHLSRKSLSIYLYTHTRPEDEIVPEHGTFYVQRPLPENIRPGHVLTDGDVVELKTLLARRDGWIEHYQKTELRVSSQMGELNRRLVEKAPTSLREALVKSIRFRWARLTGRGGAGDTAQRRA